MGLEEGTKRYRATRWTREGAASAEECLAVEAPLHIALNGVSYTTTMRTPGNDEALVRGLLFTEGIVPAADADFVYRATPDPETGWTARLDVTVPEASVAQSVAGRRTALASASCGVCGTREPADIEVYGPAIALHEGGTVSPADIDAMRDQMQAAQGAFRATGGCHAAALFDSNFEMLVAREDIGRHNAVDKVVGALLVSSRLADASVLFVSGRVSYEIVYKAYRAGVPILLAVSAASSLAVETGARLGLTVAGFCRDGRATVYCHEERVGSTSRVR